MRSSQYAALPDDKEFWLSLANSKTDHGIIYLIINSVRNFDLDKSTSVERIATLAKLKSYVDLLDLSEKAAPSEKETDEDDLDSQLELKIGDY